MFVSDLADSLLLLLPFLQVKGDSFIVFCLECEDLLKLLFVFIVGFCEALEIANIGQYVVIGD